MVLVSGKPPGLFDYGEFRHIQEVNLYRIANTYYFDPVVDTGKTNQGRVYHRVSEMDTLGEYRGESKI